MKYVTSNDRHILLIATVGGTVEPVVAGIKHWRPERIVFIVSPETYSQVDEIRICSRGEGFPIAEGAYDSLDVGDAQDFGGCVQIFRGLDDHVAKWLSRSAQHQVVVELTGGTKAMSAALALVARRWPCFISYVGGLERTKGGVGVVVSGTEKVLHATNPWNSLGYQAIEDACLAFDTGSYAIAAHYLEFARNNAEDPRVKKELAAVLHVVQGYDQWDRFRHRKAIAALENACASANDLLSALGATIGNRVLSLIDQHLRHLNEVVKDAPNRALLLDLLANARRRATEGRYDDAVARLYRATEAAAQLRLRDAHGIPSTSSVYYTSVPEPLATEWKAKGLAEPMELGLARAYELLSALGDPLAERYMALGLNDKGSPLSVRNTSILAHGFEPVGRDVCDKLWSAVLKIVEANERELPEFPRLSMILPLRAVQ